MPRFYIETKLFLRSLPLRVAVSFQMANEVLELLLDEDNEVVEVTSLLFRFVDRALWSRVAYLSHTAVVVVVKPPSPEQGHALLQSLPEHGRPRGLDAGTAPLIQQNKQFLTMSWWLPTSKDLCWILWHKYLLIWTKNTSSPSCIGNRVAQQRYKNSESF